MSESQDPKALLRADAAKAELIKELETNKRLSIDSATISALGGSGLQEEKPAEDPMTTTVDANVPKAAESDPLMEKTPEHQKNLAFSDQKEIEFLPDKVSVTPEDKSAFIDAVLQDGRYVRSFSLYGGKVTGTFRSRTSREHDAIIGFLTSRVQTGVITNDADYFHNLRALVFMAQVERLNGVEYACMAEPLFPKQPDSDPGWLEAYRFWLDREERNCALTGPLFEELRKFERKYWTMIACSGELNFFDPAESV